MSHVRNTVIRADFLFRYFITVKEVIHDNP